eukprot:135617-Pyramimonas_sp.AAC.1
MLRYQARRAGHAEQSGRRAGHAEQSGRVAVQVEPSGRDARRVERKSNVEVRAIFHDLDSMPEYIRSIFEIMQQGLATHDRTSSDGYRVIYDINCRAAETWYEDGPSWAASGSSD